MPAPPMPQGPLARYEALLASGDLTRDPAQETAMARLDVLAAALAAPAGRGRGLLSRLLGRAGGSEAPRGVYLHGGVGRGKSMLMDLFFETAPAPAKRRVHFHAFMQEAHRAIHAERRSDRHGAASDTIGAVARRVAGPGMLLCFDEFHVDDIADAMILGRLFEKLFARGVVAVATSNLHPRDLYAGGINRQLFLPFIAMLEDRLEIVAVDSGKDYRMAFLAETGLYHAPADERARRALDAAFARLVGDADVEPAGIEVQGRVLRVPRQARHVARFSFEELCARPLGGADYLALARHFHTVVIDGVPVMTRRRRDEAKRFVALVDILYENRVGLLCSAEAGPDDLCPAGDGAFEFRRTASRLVEMRSAGYLEGRKTRAA